MSEEPKSIWGKKWTGWRGFLMWSIVVVGSALVVFAAILMLVGKTNPFGSAVVISLSCVLFGLGVGLFIPWAWKNFRRFLFGFACLATLMALFYAEEDWRGWHAWKRFKQEQEVRGEKLDFADFVPATVPDDQNFAMAPVFDVTDKLASHKWREQHQKRQAPWTDDDSWDVKLVDPLNMPVAGSGNTGAPDDRTNWVVGRMIDLKAWQDYYRGRAAKTNEFSVAAQSGTPARDVLLALSKYDGTIEELREAARRPESRFPLDYDQENPAVILLPHLAGLKRAGVVLQLRAVAELQDGQTDKAFDDVKLMFRLSDSVRNEPFIISQLVRAAIMQLALQPIWEGLAERRWSDNQLTELDAELAKQDFIAGYELGIRGERAAHIKIIDWLEQRRSRFGEFFNIFADENNRERINDFEVYLCAYLGPKGWFDRNKILLVKLDARNLAVVDDARRIVSPRNLAPYDYTAVLKPSNFVLRILWPELTGYTIRMAYAQNHIDEARVAIALERYRRVHGEFPESLGALSPQFIDNLPHDIIDGEPMHYRRTADGQFILYSIGWNDTDDNGVVGLTNQHDKANSRQGDWVWRYPSK